MKLGRTIMEMAAELNRQEDVKRDFIADSKELKLTSTSGKTETVETEEGEIRKQHQSTIEIAGQGEFAVNHHTHSQIAAKLAIPLPYYRKMQTERPDLLDQNVNSWLRESAGEAKRNMVRTLDGTARAFLSDRYRRLDHVQVAEQVLPIVLDKAQGFEIASCEVTDYKMYLKVVSPKREGEVRKGDVVRAGFIVTNSEIGTGAIEVRAFLERLICTNGMVAMDRDTGKRKHHVGRAHGGFTRELNYASDTNCALDRAFFLQVRDAIHSVASESNFALMVSRMQESAAHQITGDIPASVVVLGKSLGLRETERVSVLDQLIRGGDFTQFGMIQALTDSAAASKLSYDRATHMEEMGGKVLALPPGEWKAIAEAKPEAAK
jgi:hypothetical protein